MVFDDSRYIRTRIFNRLGYDSPSFAIRSLFSFNQNNCQIHEWVQGDTLDGVAYKYYENPDLRWAILDANPQYRTEFGIKNGDILLIPDYEEVVDIVNV